MFPQPHSKLTKSTPKGSASKGKDDSSDSSSSSPEDENEKKPPAKKGAKKAPVKSKKSVSKVSNKCIEFV